MVPVEELPSSVGVETTVRNGDGWRGGPECEKGLVANYGEVGLRRIEK